MNEIHTYNILDCRNQEKFQDYPSLSAEKMGNLFTTLNELATKSKIPIWQLSLISKGSFTVPSIFRDDFRESSCSGSILLHDNSVLYFFQDINIWLITSEISKGRIITGFIIPELKLIATNGHPLPSHFNLSSFSIDITLSKKPQPITIRPVIGHPNFAHHIWNELSAIDALLQIEGGLPHCLKKIFFTYAPFCKLDGIFPEISFERIKEKSILSFEEGIIWLPLGSQMIANSTKKRVIEACECSLEESVLETVKKAGLLNTNSLNIWISIRIHNRTIGSQENILAKLCNNLLEKYSNARIILDGFSLPDDIHTNENYKNAAGQFLSHANETKKVSDLIIMGIPDAIKDRIINAAGSSLALSIYLSKHCRFYICHHGTQQHKIGWLNAIPGICHANDSIIKSLPAGWVASQSEDSVLPTYIMSESIKGLGVSSEPWAEYFESYEFINSEYLSELALTQLNIELSNGNESGI